MNKAGKIISVNPPRAIAGGEVFIECENFQITNTENFGCFFGGEAARVIGASRTRVIAAVPDTDFDSTDVEIQLESDGERSNSFQITIGRKIAEDLHLVANPAVDPNDDAIILTRSGSRGQQLPVTLFRLEKTGFLTEMSAEIMNPTGVAFDRDGQLFVTARGDGEVFRVSVDEEVVPFATDLGIPTGIAFDKNGEMFVGDRGGTLYRVTDAGKGESFALLEPSVSAYHLAFGAQDASLYVTAPGLSSFDAIYRIDRDGFDEIFYRGLGRPQGLAFDRAGNLYAAACIGGRHGIVRIAPDGEAAEIFVAGMNVVGLCFTRKGELIAATGDAVYSLPIGVEGILLD
jgi:sugar lactone lactonase YvrE